MLPHAAALIFTGLRLGLAMGFIGIVIAELLITPTGIGDLITYHSSVGRLPEDVRGHRLDRRGRRGLAPPRCSALESRLFPRD